MNECTRVDPEEMVKLLLAPFPAGLRMPQGGGDSGSGGGGGGGGGWGTQPPASLHPLWDTQEGENKWRR